MCTVNLGRRLDLQLVARRIQNAEYNPVKYNPVVLRIKKPSSTANVFTFGKLICTGTHSREDALKATRRFARLINPLVKYCNFCILNLVCSIFVGKRLQLNHLYLRFEKCIYEPTLFPGLKIPIPFNDNMKVIPLIFHTGKIIITGAKNRC